jgi:hypothetical protein
MKKQTLRKIVSLIGLWSFIFVSWTGLTLYFVPQGRIAYWVFWEFAGLTKTQYSEIHQTFSLLFLIVMILHIWLNWKAIMLYLKNKAKKFVFFTKEMLIATIISIWFLLGTLYGWPPFSNFLNALNNFKDSYEDVYEAPPFGHAELLSLQNFCMKMNLDLNQSLKILKNSGIKKLDPKKSLKTIAEENNTTPHNIYSLIKNLKNEKNKSNETIKIEEEPQISGLGRMNIEKLAQKAEVPLDIALKRLNKKGIKADKKSKVKDLAESNGMLPVDFYYIIKGK